LFLKEQIKDIIIIPSIEQREQNTQATKTHKQAKHTSKQDSCWTARAPARMHGPREDLLPHIAHSAQTHREPNMEANQTAKGVSFFPHQHTKTGFHFFPEV
jgi:hypothetical protein